MLFGFLSFFLVLCGEEYCALAPRSVGCCEKFACWKSRCMCSPRVLNTKNYGIFLRYAESILCEM